MSLSIRKYFNKDNLTINRIADILPKFLYLGVASMALFRLGKAYVKQQALKKIQKSDKFQIDRFVLCFFW